MANTRFAYVRSFEVPDPLLPETYIVCRVDGRSFHKFTDTHGFTKPNDVRGLGLMDAAAQSVMHELRDVVLAFGESDEYSFMFRKHTTLYTRRSSKLLSTLLSIFTSAYVFHWPAFFPQTKLQYPPSFDARIVLYPNEGVVRDYFAWRQADTHINNLYNTAFWALVQQGGMSTAAAHAELRGTVSAQKHEILHGRFGINYNALPAMFRKGSVLVRKPPEEIAPEGSDVSRPAPAVAVEEEGEEPAIPDTAAAAEAAENQVPAPTAEETPPSTKKPRKKRQPPPWDGTSGEVEVLHVDIIGDTFWEERPWLLR